MIVETLILISDQHTHELRIDLGRRGFEPPAAICCRKGPQQFAIAIQHLERSLPCGLQGRRIGLVQRIETEGRAAQKQRGRHDANDDCLFPAHGVAERTSMRPVAVRAANCGRYISSTEAAG